MLCGLLEHLCVLQNVLALFMKVWRRASGLLAGAAAALAGVKLPAGLH